MKQPLLLFLAIVPAVLIAQNDTVPAPPAPPADVVAPLPPSPSTPGAVVTSEKDGRRIVVVKGDTTIIVTTDRSGNIAVVREVKGEEGVSVLREDTITVLSERSKRIQVGVSSKEGGFVHVIDGDTTRNDPITINTKNKVIRIYSDDKRTPNDSARAAERLKELRTERRNTFTYWSGLDLGVNTLLGPDGDADLDKAAEFMEIDNGRSRFFSINFMEQKIGFGSHHAGLMTGLGWEFTNYHLKNNVLLAYTADSVYGIPVETPEFRKNKLRQMGLRMPLMLEFNTKRAPLPTREELAAGKKTSYSRKGNFHIAMGVVGSWYFDTMYKQKYRLEGEERKDRDKGDFHLLPYRAAASVRVGYGGLNLFAEYALTPLFKDGKGPELTPFNVGLTIIGFN